MDKAIYEALNNLKNSAQNSSDSDIPVWLRELVVENVTKMIKEGASNQIVGDTLAGGLRAIIDASSPNEDDPIINQIVSIIDKTE